MYVGAAHVHAVEVLKCSGDAARVAGSSRKNCSISPKQWPSRRGCLHAHTAQRMQ